jgi:ABC-type proline/glycine betaine transport system substrate-binding protein
MRGDVLKSALLDGTKAITLRAWVKKTQDIFRARIQDRKLVRVQSNYNFNSIYGWATILAMQGPAHPHSLLTPTIVSMAGRPDLTVLQYIEEYCTFTLKDRNNRVVKDSQGQTVTQVHSQVVIVTFNFYPL